MPASKQAASQTSRPFWSGTITFGLVSIPVDLFPAVRSREVALHMVDPKGRALGRQYFCPKHEKVLSTQDIVRGVQTKSGKYVAVTDEEIEAIAPEMSRDIELQRFVPIGQIAPKYFDHPYVLAPAGRSAKSYHLLAKVIADSSRVGIGTFVMRGHQYLVAILSDGSILRAQTLRFDEELRSAAEIGLPKAAKAGAAAVKRLAAAIKSHTGRSLARDDLADRYAEALRRLAGGKAKAGRDVVNAKLTATTEDTGLGEAQVVDLMERLRQSLGRAKRSGRPGSAGTRRAIARTG